MVRIQHLLLLLTGLALGLASCGDGDGPAAAPAPVSTGPIRGRYVGQEIWITYKSDEHAEFGRRLGRSRDDAKKLAESLRRRVIAGEDIGALAREHSNAPGGAADGYSSDLPRDAEHPDARDRAMASVDRGEVTPLVEWLGGYWFAKRVDAQKGMQLKMLFEQMIRERVRFRAIAILFLGADIPDSFARDDVRRTREQAIEKARDLLQKIQAGESFGDLARIHSEDGPSAERDGLVMMVVPGQPATEWVRRGYTWIPAQVLDAAFATQPGQVYPGVIETERGIFLVKVEERKYVDD